MNKNTPAILLIAAISLVIVYFSIKNDLHKVVFGEGKITNFIETLRDNGRDPVFVSGQAGKIASDFILPSIATGDIKLSDYKGQLVLLNFWASWCPPCRAEIPGFIKVQNSYKDRPFTFIGVAIEDKKSASNFAKDFSINYPIAYGLENSLAVASVYGNPDGALPYSVLVSSDQKILSVHAGFLSEDKLHEIIKQNIPK